MSHGQFYFDYECIHLVLISLDVIFVYAVHELYPKYANTTVVINLDCNYVAEIRNFCVVIPKNTINKYRDLLCAWML